MPLLVRPLGDALMTIYLWPAGGAIYFPVRSGFQPDTLCLVAWSESGDRGDWEALHRACRRHGYDFWLNVAVMTDTFDEVRPWTEAGVVAAFNEDCREGGWLWRMWNNGEGRR
jgi:hypothetical protein